MERIHIQKSQYAAFLWDMLGSRKWVGELADRLPARPVNELTPVFRHFRFKDITVDHCPILVSAVGLPEQPIEDVVFENVKSPNMTTDLQDVGKFTFK